ncbi:MAG: hypothetical protein SOR60_09405 [Anaerococcus porci]|nr:hypothetical protein [Anaerococcus porci]
MIQIYRKGRFHAIKNKTFWYEDKLGYMFGDLGNGFSFALSSVFFMKFYTDVMGVSPGAIGAMMLLQGNRCFHRHRYGTNSR